MCTFVCVVCNIEHERAGGRNGGRERVGSDKVSNLPTSQVLQEYELLLPTPAASFQHRAAQRTIWKEARMNANYRSRTRKKARLPKSIIS